MGEIAESMVEGASCSWCGVYFEESHGYPVACHDCFDNERKQNPSHFQKVEGVFIHKKSLVQRAVYDEL